MSSISLSASMRSNLLSLQTISKQVDSTQNKLSTGKKVNSAIDNPSSYYTAISLTNRANDLDGLLDSMGQAVSTIKAATEALESAADFLEQAKAVANQMLENSGTTSNENITPSEPIYIPQPSGISDDASIRNTSLFDGRANTQAMIDEIGTNAVAATLCNQFYAPGVDKNDANFGQGNWYLPAIGELMEMCGFDAEGITNGGGTSGANGYNEDKINYTLSTINNFDRKAEILLNDDLFGYWSSSEAGTSSSWSIKKDGNRSSSTQDSIRNIRCFLYLENKFNPVDAASAPEIGDVMYSDLSYGSADDYDGSKTAVGVVAWVSEDGRSAKIVCLKDLSSDIHSSYPVRNDIKNIDNYNSSKFLTAFQEAVAESNAKAATKTTSTIKDTVNDLVYDTSQYTSIISQYDSLIKDSSYKGVNLLQDQDLKVTFNEGRTAWLDVLGKDASSAALGLTTLEWNSKADVEKSIEELTNAMNQIRSMSSELGSYYNIVLTRQDFTENLINVLEEGADKLTLADMNEESANMLALQTRQQLAINSLSLASQAAQGILRLF